MTVALGTQGFSATTPCTTFYTNVIAAALTAAGWVFVETVTAATAGTTADVKVWRTAATDFYLAIEPDDANTRIRFRTSESYNVSTHKMIRPVHGGTAETSYTPSADYSVPGGVGTEYTIHTATTTGFSGVQMFAGGGAYLIEVRTKLFTLAVRSGGAHYATILGHFTSLVDTVADTNPLFLFADPNSKSWSADANGVRQKAVSTSREPNTVAGLAGAFSYLIGHPGVGTNFPSSNTESNEMGTLEGGVQHYYYNGFIASPAVIHGSNLYTVPTRSMRGYLPDFVTVSGNGVTTFVPTMGTAFLVGGVPYYIVGRISDVNAAIGQTYLGIKA